MLIVPVWMYPSVLRLLAPGPCAKVDDTLLLPLAVQDGDLALLDVHVADIQRQQFGSAHARIEKHIDDRLVAFGRAFIQDAFDFGPCEGCRDQLFNARHRDGRHWRLPYQPFTHAKTKERAQGACILVLGVRR